ncbi:aldo/keto reductase family oxidoreductase [Nesterenkonia alkaliphila]|uniref:Aldo/keto reductase family oxidoreductase n=2 Tax=Nesterenkonia alkaliphila TaxID=1463631 RepID=A0A7K1UKA3_9MICC|nr:aldo/keto reductase [Nesterenkonia alkaliphila]MVT26431.1 aldo/keto reductase family oxidoreductase [Nesterenkonia alkaliphila]
MPAAGLSAPQVILGMMRIAERTDDEIRALVGAALEAGVNYVDHADIYSPGLSVHECERRFAQAMQLSPAEREQLTIQTKVGIVKDGPRYDFSYEHIISSVEGSLRALGTDYVDVLLLHRPDPLVEPEEVARAFNQLHSAGKVRHFGVSNHTPAQMELLHRNLDQPLTVNQVQLSLPHAAILTEGLLANTLGAAPHISPDGAGVVEYCRMNGIALQAWSPYQSPTGVFIGNPEYPELNAVLESLAETHGVTPTGIATAWITRHPADIQVVLGTTQPARVREAAEGADIRLSRAEWFQLLRAAGHPVP